MVRAVSRREFLLVPGNPAGWIVRSHVPGRANTEIEDIFVGRTAAAAYLVARRAGRAFFAKDHK